MVAVAVATSTTAEGAVVPVAAMEASAADGPTLEDRVAWLTEQGLLRLSEGSSKEQVVR